MIVEQLAAVVVNEKDRSITCLRNLDTTSWDCQLPANNHANNDTLTWKNGLMILERKIKYIYCYKV